MTFSGLVLPALARWLHFTGYALAFGPIAFRVLAVRGPEPASARERLQHLCHIGIALLLIAAPARFTVDAASGAIASMALRLAAALMLWAFQGALAAAGTQQEWPLLMLGVALAALDGDVSVTSLHIAAMGLWAGGLASLLAVWRIYAPGPARADLVGRFGRLAALAVTTLAATGTLLTAAHVSRPWQLVTTLWGALLIAKLAGVAIAVLLARSRRWRGELSVQTLILALAALLATVPPPR